MSIRELRRERLLSQERLAAAAGVTTRTVLTAEAGRAVSPETVRRIAIALAVPAGELDVVIAAPPRRL